MNKSLLINQPFGLEKFLSFSTITGRVVISIFGIGILSIIIQGLRHVSPTPVGDEYFYTLYAQNISKNGIYNEMVKGNPVGYSIVVNLVSRIGFSTLVAARILSTIATVFVFSSLWAIGKKYFNLNQSYLLLAILTCLFGTVTSGNHFFLASDDMYYTAFFIWIAVYLWKAVDKWNDWRKFALAGALLSCTLLIRPLALLIFPASIVTLIYMAYRTQAGIFNKTWFIIIYIVAFGVMFLLQQSPPLLGKGQIALETKIPDSVGTRVNWTQKVTLTNILREEGKKREESGGTGGMASWKQCYDYLDEHGPGSLPTNYIQRILWNPMYNLKYSAIGVIKVSYILVRHTGIVFLLPFIFLFRLSFPKYKKLAFFTVFCVAYLALYVISNLIFVEIRHLIIPMIFMVFTGIYILQSMQKEGFKYAGLFFMAQLGALFIILLLDLGFYFLAPAGWVFYV